MANTDPSVEHTAEYDAPFLGGVYEDMGWFRGDLCPGDETKQHLFPVRVQSSHPFRLTHPPRIDPEQIEYPHYCVIPPEQGRK